MMAAIQRVLDSFRGFGDYALSIPSLDGAFRPDDALEAAEALLQVKAPDNLTVAGDILHFSSGGDLIRLCPDGGSKTLWQGAPVTALAGASDGRLAVARSAAPVTIINGDGTGTVLSFPAAGTGDVTAMTFLPDGGLAVTIGAQGRRAADWRWDFMRRGRNGSVWIVDADGSARQLSKDLAYPSGVVVDGSGGLVVSTAWDAALVRLGPDGQDRPLLSNLPGYPARIVSEPSGGYWLAIFAPRNQLVEFVLREDLFAKRMMAEIEPEYWICPALAPAESPLEVMQNGAQKIGGSIKPWAPSLSYGMVAKLDQNFQPERSFHSRANGKRHGITSVAIHRGELLASSAGGNVIVRLAAA